MKYRPFFVRYASPATVIIADGTSALAITATALAAAIAAVNASPTTYGLGASDVIADAPTVPTGALGVAFVGGSPATDLGSGESFTFVDARMSAGNSLPDKGAESILTAANLAALVLANAALKPVITTGPITKSVAAPAATTFVVVSSGSGLSYQWQVSTDGGTTWTNLTNTGVYTTVTTATLNISDTTGLTARQYRCVVTNSSGTATSARAVLTVT